ncbi:hypothetical protein M405DRAFT_383450 [Rhizopogon salebrosus TDB-379]|nr:hypothetical protein M405DRAFT_619187 [Rhizopogon salebrosus TDB-379]KAJ8585958.1 hypothetical protein M405DRAFT_383450 [Rhizopogon salebrosus TDB-379]
MIQVSNLLGYWRTRGSKTINTHSNINPPPSCSPSGNRIAETYVVPCSDQVSGLLVRWSGVRRSRGKDISMF